MKKYIVLLMFAIIGLTSCERDEPEIQNTSTYPVNGEWWVKYEAETSPGVFEDIYGAGYTSLLTFNTSTNTPDSIWISDEGHFWDYKVKTGLKMADYSFAATGRNNLSYDILVDVVDGKIIKDKGMSKSGVKVDSIYFKVKFEDDDNTFRVSGHRRTGFLEDEF